MRRKAVCSVACLELRLGISGAREESPTGLTQMR